MIKNMTPVKIASILIMLIVICNLIAYPFLPAIIGIHWDMSGNADSVVPKLAGLFFQSLIAIGIYFYVKLMRKITDFRIVIISLLLLAINIVLIYVNIK